MGDKKNKREILAKFMSEMYQIRTRSEIWNFLYETEYESDSVELNETMAGMTDAEVFEWFPKMCAEHIAAKLGL